MQIKTIFYNLPTRYISLDYSFNNHKENSVFRLIANI